MTSVNLAADNEEELLLPASVFPDLIVLSGDFHLEVLESARARAITYENNSCFSIFHNIKFIVA